MQLEFHSKKSFISNSIVFSFIIFIALSAFYSEFFQAPEVINHEMNQFRFLISKDKLDSTQQLIIKNNLGSFHFEKEEGKIEGQWKIISPRSLPANDDLINKILSVLQNIQIKSIHEKDKIGLANFSLNSPLIEITLLDQNGNSNSIKFGLVNPFDNSTYATVSSEDAIFHINAIGTPLGSLDLTNFIDSRVFSFIPEKIQSFAVHQSDLSGKNPYALFTFDNEKWIGKDTKELDDQKVLDHLHSLTKIKSNLIIDKTNEELDKKISQYFEKPWIKIDVKSIDNEETTYTISSQINSLPNMKIEKWQNVLIKSSNRNVIYLINKNLIKDLQKNDRWFKKIPFKKLFY